MLYLYLSKLDLAEFVLNRCVTQVEKRQSQQLTSEDEDSIDYSSANSDSPEDSDCQEDSDCPEDSDSPEDSDCPKDSDCPEVYYNYGYLEDITVQQDAKGQVLRQQSFMYDDETDGPIIQKDIESASPLTSKSSDNHVLKWMVCFR